jgi:hypothetical protein
MRGCEVLRGGVGGGGGLLDCERLGCWWRVKLVDVGLVLDEWMDGWMGVGRRLSG